MSFAPNEWSTAAKWGLGANLGGMVLGGIGSYIQNKNSEKALEEAQAVQAQYESDLAAYQDAKARAAHGAAMARFNAQRAAELAVLRDQGATADELAQHDYDLGRQFIEAIEVFGPEAYNAAVEENQEAAQEEGEEALAEARAERPEQATRSGSSATFKEAAANAMARADAGSDKYLSGMTKLTGRTRTRPKEEAAIRNVGLLGDTGARARAHIENMAGLRQRRLGYIPPTPPSGPSSNEGMPVEPDVEIPVSNSGNWLTAIGSLLGTGAQVFGTWNRYRNN